MRWMPAIALLCGLGGCSRGMSGMGGGGFMVVRKWAGERQPKSQLVSE